VYVIKVKGPSRNYDSPISLTPFRANYLKHNVMYWRVIVIVCIVKERSIPNISSYSRYRKVTPQTKMIDSRLTRIRPKSNVDFYQFFTRYPNLKTFAIVDRFLYVPVYAAKPICANKRFSRNIEAYVGHVKQTFTRSVFKIGKSNTRPNY